MNFCPTCTEKNPGNANICLHCNAALPYLQARYEARVKADFRRTVFFIVVTTLFLVGIAFYYTLPNFSDEDTIHATSHVCIPHDAEKDLIAPYLEHGYIECDIQTSQQCPTQTTCMKLIITDASMNPTR